MTIIKLTFAAAALTLGLSASASALPIGNLGTVPAAVGAQIDQVRLVCNRWGRCWRTPDYGYGYRRPFGFYGGYGGGYRGGWRGRRW